MSMTFKEAMQRVRAGKRVRCLPSSYDYQQIDTGCVSPAMMDGKWELVDEPKKVQLYQWAYKGRNSLHWKISEFFYLDDQRTVQLSLNTEKVIRLDQTMIEVDE